MASKMPRINSKSKCLVATLVTENRAPCVFCQRLADDEVIYGKLYAIGDIQCHYFCVLLSCCLIQKGKDEEGLFGFLYADILAEVERSKKHRCSFCGKGGATLGCSVAQCRKQFHLPCGRERSAVSLFYGNYKSFCELHAPKQKVPEHIMANARVRLRQAKCRRLHNPKAPPRLSGLKELNESPAKDDTATDASAVDSVCVICYEAVEGFPTARTFWPPCCARDAWFHRACLQRMALSAGMHYLKCPLCNDKDNFHDALLSQGYYVPDRDAAWELEQNAFAEIYERPLECSADECLCPSGRGHDAEAGDWDIKLCLLCGTTGTHAGCSREGAGAGGRFVCRACAPAAPPPAELAALHARLEAVILAEQAQAAAAQSETRRPLMPSRMSLRRTKQRHAHNAPSTSRATSNPVKTESNEQAQKTDTETSRLELNLKTPKRQTKSQNPIQKPIFEATVLKDIENILLSPLKLVEQGLHERIRCMGVKEIAIDSNKVLERVREKFMKPRPLCVKKRIVNNILESIFNNVVKNNPKTKEALREWRSPKKTVDSSSSIQVSSQENKVLTDNPLLRQYLETGKWTPKRSPLSPKRRTPIKIKITSTETKENNPQKVLDNDKKEIDNVLINDDSTPSKRDSTKEASKDSNTPVKIESSEDICQEDSTTKTADKEDGESDNSTLLKENKGKEISDKKDCVANETLANDESSNSTFVVPAEFVADRNSDDSLPLFETPKKLKTIDIQKDSSLEICENDEVVNINHIRIERNAEKSEFLKNLNLISPVKTKKCAYKFSNKDKEILEEQNMDIDLESFKNYYLNEVDREFKCNFGHKHKVKEEKDDQTSTKLRTAIDYALEAFKRENVSDNEKNLKKTSSVEELPQKKSNLKRKTSATEEIPKKKKKKGKQEKKKKEQQKSRSPKIRLVYNSKTKRKRDARKNKKNNCVKNKNQKEDSNTNIQVVCASNAGSKEKNVRETIDLTIEASSERKNKTKKKNKHKKMLKQNIQVKIRFKEEQLRLKITKSQRKKPKKKREKLLQQYVLKYCSSDNKKTVNSPETVIVKPEHPVTPIKRKYNLKQDKSPDNLVQTSIQSFFKVKPPQ